MRQDHMFDGLVASPAGLKSALEDPALRQCHIIDGDIVEHTKEALAFGHIRRDEQNNVLQFPEGGRRRIDYIIYHKSYPVVSSLCIYFICLTLWCLVYVHIL